MIHGYTLRIVGEIVIDPDNRTVSGQLHITVTDRDGVVVFEKDVTFKYTWGGTTVVPFSSPDGSIRGTMTISSTGASVNLQPRSGGRFAELRPAQLDRLR